MQQRTILTHTSPPREYRGYVMYVMAWHYAHWCYCSHNENYNVDLFPTKKENQLKYLNRVWFDTYNASSSISWVATILQSLLHNNITDHFSHIITTWDSDYFCLFILTSAPFWL